jgi:hypothetical protein
LCGCDLFKVRDAQDPAKPPDWNDFCTSWELSLQNLQYSYTDSRNFVKYSSLFTENFSFHFAAQDVNDYNINGQWNLNTERDMLFSLQNDVEGMQLEFQVNSGSQDQVQATEAIIYRSYILRVLKGSGETIYKGDIELHFRQVNGIWRIYKWYDYRNSLSPTWGKLKYDYYS